MKRNTQIILICILAVILIALLAVAARLNAPQHTEAPETTGTTAGATTQTTAEPTIEPTTQTTTAETTQPYVPEISPDTVGLYIPAEDGTRARALVMEFSAKRTAKTDIDCFEVIASQDARLEGSSFASIWNAAWDSYENTENAKIGFVISFDLAGGQTVTKTILKPSDSADFYDYLEIYLYDDIHQTPGVWYTHLEDKDMEDDTVISSIKLTAGSKIGEVGDITLTAFIYNGEDCFDETGAYIGQAAYTVAVTQ